MKEDKENKDCPDCEGTGIVFHYTEKPNYYGPNEGETFTEEMECEKCQ